MKIPSAPKLKTALPGGVVDFAAIARELAALPERAVGRRTDTKRYFVERLREPLTDAVANRRLSLSTLAEFLRARGIEIRPDTLRRYLGPIASHRIAARADNPPPCAAPSDPSPPTGSPAALARLEPALADALSPSPWPRERSGAPDGVPPAPAPGTFVPRPERPIDWYQNGKFNGAPDD